MEIFQCRNPRFKGGRGEVGRIVPVRLSGVAYYARLLMYVDGVVLAESDLKNDPSALENIGAFVRRCDAALSSFVDPAAREPHFGTSAQHTPAQELGG